MKAQKCALILLASGLSERFGDANKLLADLNGKPVIAHVKDSISEIEFGARIAVVSDDKTGRLLAASGFTLLTNTQPEAGQGHALSLGAKAAGQGGFHAACVMLGDMPFVGAAHMEKLLANSEDNAVVMSECEGVLMPPALFRGTALADLETASGARGAKPGLHGPRPACVPLTPREAFDIDTPEGLAAARRLG